MTGVDPNTPAVYIGLDNPKSPGNVQAILRAAGNFGADGIIYTGQRYPQAMQRNPAPDLARKTGRGIPLTQVDNLLDLPTNDLQIVCVEFAENAIALPEFRHPDRALYLFGPEDGTLDQATINQSDAVVYIPTSGCMNLAATVTVVLYDRMTRRGQDHSGNEHIRRNRDRNNQLIVRS